jgi:hypothetical protein
MHIQERLNLTDVFGVRFDLYTRVDSGFSSVKISITYTSASVDFGIWDYQWTVYDYPNIPWATAKWFERGVFLNEVNSTLSLSGIQRDQMYVSVFMQLAGYVDVDFIVQAA